MSPFYAMKLEQKGLNARLGGGRLFLAGKIFDTMKGWKSIDSLAEMLMKFLSFHTASTQRRHRVSFRLPDSGPAGLAGVCDTMDYSCVHRERFFLGLSEPST